VACSPPRHQARPLALVPRNAADGRLVCSNISAKGKCTAHRPVRGCLIRRCQD
jgi:hypothetical protein